MKEAVPTMEYHGAESRGLFPERAKKLIVQIGASRGVTEIKTGFGLGEGIYTGGEVQLDLIVAIIVNGTVHAFSLKEAGMLAETLKEAAEAFPNNPLAKIGLRIADDISGCIKQAKQREGEIRALAKQQLN